MTNPTDPKLIKPSGKKPNRELNAMERAIAAKIKKDPRLDTGTKEQVLGLYEATGVDPQGTQDPPAWLAAAADDTKELMQSEAAEYARTQEQKTLDDTTLGDGGQRSTNTALTDMADAMAAEAFGAEEEDDRFALQKRLPVVDEKPASPKDTAEEKEEEEEEEKPPEGLPTSFLRDADFFRILEAYEISEENALRMILDQEKPVTKEAKQAIWEKELELAGIKQKEVDDAIHQFLSLGYVAVEKSYQNGAIKINLHSRTTEDAHVHDARMANASGGEDIISPQLAERLSFTWKVAASLQKFDGMGKKFARDPDKTKGENFDEAVEFIKSLPAIAFQLICDDLSYLDQLTYFASQKIAVENF